MKKIPLAPEGWAYILPLMILTALSLLMQWYAAAIILGAFTLFLLNFFRDPRRIDSSETIDVLSPADGTVVQISDLDHPPWEGLARRISIFMSIFDVHVNRAPITGKIVRYEYSGGRNLAAFSEKSSEANEQNLIVMKSDEGEHVALSQIAGLLARRIVFDHREGDRVARGERIGMIKFGSRVDLFLSPASEVLVKIRDKVKVGQTVIARMPKREDPK
jgi:phosphatidylserine decarboxylase